MLDRRVVENLVAQKRPFLHQSKHERPSRPVEASKPLPSFFAGMTADVQWPAPVRSFGNLPRRARRQGLAGGPEHPFRPRNRPQPARSHNVYLFS
jgi:hypothetical protein